MLASEKWIVLGICLHFFYTLRLERKDQGPNSISHLLDYHNSSAKEDGGLVVVGKKNFPTYSKKQEAIRPALLGVFL